MDKAERFAEAIATLIDAKLAYNQSSELDDHKHLEYARLELQQALAAIMPGEEAC